MKRTVCIILIAFVILLSALALPYATASAAVNDSYIRVLLSASGKATATISVTGNYSVGDTAFTGGTLTASVSGGKVSLSHSALGKLASDVTSVTVARGENASNEAGLLGVGGRTYLGDLTFYISEKDSAALWIINRLPLKEYVYGAVSGEVGDSSNAEVLKAQTIIAKCFALVEAQSSGSKKFDVYDTTTSQVYVGYQAQKANTFAAVDAVWQNTLMYGSSVVKTHYGSYNGGVVITPYTRWGGTTPYEKAYQIKYDPFDLFGSSQNVTVAVAGAAPHTMPEGLYNYLLGKADAAVSGTVTEIVSVDSITGYNGENNSTRYPEAYAPQSGMKIKLTVRTDAGAVDSCTLDLSFENIKSGAGISGGGSISFVTKVNDGMWHLCYGNSNGPRVGLSHRGANEMARLGYGYADILKFYYPGAKLVDANGGEIASTAALDIVSVLDTIGKAGAHAPVLVGYGTVNADDIKLRAGPATSYTILAALNTGEALELYTKSGEWYYAVVIATGKQGYIYGKYVTRTDGTPPPTTEPTAEPTTAPTTEPTTQPTTESTATPTAKPTAETSAPPTAGGTPGTTPGAEGTATPAATATPTAPAGIMGDANGDGVVTTPDVTLILRYSVGLETLTETQLALADVNRDGQVTAADAAIILRFIMHLIAAF